MQSLAALSDPHYEGPDCDLLLMSAGDGLAAQAVGKSTADLTAQDLPEIRQGLLDWKANTRADNVKQLAKIEVEFGGMRSPHWTTRAPTREFLDWRDRLSGSQRQADYAWTVLMRVLSWARGRGLTAYRPPERVERLYHADRSEKIWENEHVVAFMEAAPAPLQRALALALETGQRQGDLLVLPWSTYDGEWIWLKQSKGRRKVEIPVTRRLWAVLENTPTSPPSS